MVKYHRTYCCHRTKGQTLLYTIVNSATITTTLNRPLKNRISKKIYFSLTFINMLFLKDGQHNISYDDNYKYAYDAFLWSNSKT